MSNRFLFKEKKMPFLKGFCLIFGITLKTKKEIWTENKVTQKNFFLLENFSSEQYWSIKCHKSFCCRFLKSIYSFCSRDRWYFFFYFPFLKSVLLFNLYNFLYFTLILLFSYSKIHIRVEDENPITSHWWWCEISKKSSHLLFYKNLFLSI